MDGCMNGQSENEKIFYIPGNKKCILVCEGHPLVSTQESCIQEQPVAQMLKI